MSMEEVRNVVLVATPLQLLSVDPSLLTENPENNIEFRKLSIDMQAPKYNPLMVTFEKKNLCDFWAILSVL